MKVKLLKRIRRKWEIRKTIHRENGHQADGQEIYRAYRKGKKIQKMWITVEKDRHKNRDYKFSDSLVLLVIGICLYETWTYRFKDISVNEINDLKSYWTGKHPKAARRSLFEVVWP